MENRTIKCEFCPREFRTVKKGNPLYVHCRRAHPDNIKLAWPLCLTCKGNFAPEIIESHERACLAKMKDMRICEFCNDAFATLEDLIVHASILHQSLVKAKWQVCPTCQEFFPQLGMCAKCRFPKKAPAVRAPQSCSKCASSCQCQSKIAVTKETSKCSFCSRHFENIQETLNHARSCHPEEVKNAWMTCYRCHVLYPKKLFHYHTKMDCEFKRKTGLLCSFCPAKFLAEHKLYQHCRYVHRQEVYELWWPCESCGLHFPQRRKAHCKNFNCEFCDQFFPTFFGYSEHAYQDHPDQIAISWEKCQGCGKYLPEGKILNGHKQECGEPEETPAETKEKSEKKYECQFCDYITTFSFDFVQHVNRRHFDLVSQSSKFCSVCLKYIPGQLGFARHFRSCRGAKSSKSRESICKLKPASNLPKCSAPLNSLHMEHVEELEMDCNGQMHMPNQDLLKNHNSVKLRTEDQIEIADCDLIAKAKEVELACTQKYGSYSCPYCFNL